MVHVGINEHDIIEIVDGHTVIKVSKKDIKKFFKELERMIKWLDKKGSKKE